MRVDGPEVEGPAHSESGLWIAMRLLENRQRLVLVLLTLGRIAVGICDLSVAAAMYLLFLLLQGRTTLHSLWWTPKTVLSAAAITMVVVVLRSLTDLFSSHFTFRQMQNLYTAFLLRLTEGYSRIRWDRFVERNRSELSGHALHTTREVADFYRHCVEMTANVVIVAVMTAALVYQSLAAACILGSAVAAFYAVHRFLIRKKIQVAASSRESSLLMLRRNLADMFSSGKEIRTYGSQPFFQERIRRQAERVAARTVSVWFLPQLAQIVADQGAVLTFLGIVVAVQLRQGDARQLLSLLVFYFVISRRLIPLVSQISYVAGQMEGSFESVKVLDSELTKCRRSRTSTLPMRLPDTGLALQVIQISFSYRGGAPILQNVNLSLRKGETIVLHGASGIGKSSLLNLIAGVSQPMTGFVRVDRSSIAYVPQEIPLLDDSIRNNLLFGLSGRSDEDLMKALEVASLDEFVKGQTLGLETCVGDNGSLFSGGQRQRLGLARAILRSSQLLLLDEATSALDEKNERQVLANLNASGMAIVLATHRLHVRTFAHRVFRLEDGALVEEFNYEKPTIGKTHSPVTSR
jgi:ABC-type bacteriocin/lantibiotic exporter with double-glycine peptidase domain